MAVAFVDVSGLDWDEDKPTIVQTPMFAWVELHESVVIAVPERPFEEGDSFEIDLLFLEPDLA
jgi:hypothetical protein